MVGRDVANLAYLAPGVKAADSYDPTKNRYAILSVNGAGGRNVNACQPVHGGLPVLE